MQHSANYEIVHHNQPQIDFLLTDGAICCLIFGRGTGKTEGCTAPWLLDRLLAMPRCTGGLLIPDYANGEKILSHIWKYWDRLGFTEGEDYMIGVEPPENWPKGFNQPKKKFDRYVTFKNGSGFYILSSKTKHNGSDLDFLAVEEARLIPEIKFREIDLAVRGNTEYFGHLYQHHSRLFVTDRPRTPEEKWVEKYELMHNHELSQSIKTLHVEAIRLETKAERAEIDTKAIEYITRANRLRNLINELRKNNVYYAEASTFDNVHALGFKTILQFYRTLSRRDFEISVLNKKNLMTDSAFYPYFSETHKIEIKLDESSELDIAFDYNHAINSMVIGQQVGNYYFVQAMHVKHPFNLSDLVAKFAKYYESNKVKRVNYYFNHTALQGKNAISNVTFKEQIVNQLIAKGWRVIERYSGQATSHDSRYEFFNKLFAEVDKSMPKVRIDIHTGKFLCKSLENAKAGTRNGRTIKVKTDESNPNIDQATTTHYSEAFDDLIIGKFGKLAKGAALRAVRI